MTMKTQILAMTIILAVTGCSQKVTEVPGLDRVLTASEFAAQAALRERVLRFCADDPGRYRTDPNCVNSQQSLRANLTGSGKFPPLDTTLPTFVTGKK
jgi:hypothetical protein